MSIIRAALRTFVIVAIGATVAIGSLLGALWLEHRAELTLPAPTGPFPVGRAIQAWRDDTTVDPLAPAPGTKRELLVWIWYPAAPGSPAAPDDYVPAASLAAAERARGQLSPPAVLMTRFLTRDPSKVRTHSVRNAALSPHARSFPVLIMRGGASAPVTNYSTLAEDLASHGYVVVGVDAPYRTSVVVFPDGRVATRTPANNPEQCVGRAASCIEALLAAWTSDIAFVVDRLEQLNASDSPGTFAGRLDTTRLGVFGHSFGGAQAAQFCHDDARCKAGVDIDGNPFGSVVGDGLRQPFMFLLSGQIHSADPEDAAIAAKIQSIYDRLPADGRPRVAIRGANHFLFSDDGALMKSHLVLGALRRLGVLGIDGRRQLAVTAYCVRRFFDAYLEPGSHARLDLTSPLYPEIDVLE